MFTHVFTQYRIFLPLSLMLGDAREKTVWGGEKKAAIRNMDADGFAQEKSDLIEFISIFEGCCTKGCLR